MESAAALELEHEELEDDEYEGYPNDDPNDPTYYSTEEKLGDDVVQSLVAEAFRPLLGDYLEHIGVTAYVGHDQFMFYTQGDPSACVSPDVYVMPGAPPFDDFDRWGSWKKWQGGGVPSFALEIMSENNKKKKDDRKSPARHDALGTKELIVFDPYADKSFRFRRRKPRIRFRIFQRNAADRLVLVEETNDLMIWSESLDCHLCVVGNGNRQRLRIATGPRGETLFPTPAEAEAARAREALKFAKEQNKLANEQMKLANEQTRLAEEQTKLANEQARRAESAEAEVERLRAELAALAQRI